MERNQQIDAEMADTQFKELEREVLSERNARVAAEAEAASQLHVLTILHCQLTPSIMHRT